MRAGGPRSQDEYYPMKTGPTEIDQCLREYFNFQSFRQGQRELIEVVLAGKDSLGVLPTGWVIEKLNLWILRDHHTEDRIESNRR
jgi:hypothetical protein